MANQPQVRPWFRLASIRSVAAPAPVPTPAPAPAPASETRPAPTSRPSSLPSSPPNQPTQPQPQPQPQSQSQPTQPRAVVDRGPTPSPPSSPRKVFTSHPTSPLQKAPLTSSPNGKSPSSSSSSPSPLESPKTIEQTNHSPKHSPNYKTTTSPPPSPLTLPPSQLKAEPNIPTEAEQKNVLVQRTINKHKPKESHYGGFVMHRETGETRDHERGKEIATKEKGVHRKASDSEDSGMRIITISGENRGAYMELVNSPKKHEHNYLHKKGNSNGKTLNGVESGASSSEEGNTHKKDKNHRSRTTSSIPMAAYMNSNVQCVNNSLLYHTSCTHHDPGVRLSLSKKPFGQGFHLKEHVHGQNT